MEGGNETFHNVHNELREHNLEINIFRNELFATLNFLNQKFKYIPNKNINQT